MQPFRREVAPHYDFIIPTAKSQGIQIHAKAGGHYVNSILASQEAKAKGFDEALLTDLNGFVAEGPGANVFLKKMENWSRPRWQHLPGITRATVEICGRPGIDVKKIFTTTVEKADAFFCGTAAEVIGWESLDDIPFAKPWNETLGDK
jgi:branched-chain amino acid aminotransferase